MERAARGVGVWGTRVAMEAQWVTKVEERGTAAFGELDYIAFLVELEGG